MTRFHLSKWYLDYVTDRGDVEIAYTGNVRWGPVRLQYSSVLQTAESRVRERRSLRPQPLPQAKGSTISWRSNALKIETVWEGVAPAVRETIYRSGGGSVEWNCLMPLARAQRRERELEVAKCDLKFGFGYVEHLEMTIAPWKLPIRTLRWGRFTSASDWVTWIDWQGDFPLRLVYVNGETISCSRVEDDRLEAEDGTRLFMDRSLVLRDGPLGTTALAAVPGISKMFPARLLEMNECKWRSRSRLERRDKPPVEGWAIHEKVSWAS